MKRRSKKLKNSSKSNNNNKRMVNKKHNLLLIRRRRIDHQKKRITTKIQPHLRMTMLKILTVSRTLSSRVRIMLSKVLVSAKRITSLTMT